MKSIYIIIIAFFLKVTKKIIIKDNNMNITIQENKIINFMEILNKVLVKF